MKDEPDAATPENVSVDPLVPGGTSGRGTAQAKRRVRFLDCLRGIALCGIFPVNIVFFAMAADSADAYGLSLPLLDRIGNEVKEGFFTFRFVTLFSFLFGVGIFLLDRKCTRDGIPSGRMFAQRFFALLLFGALHVIFLWYGDILIYYAVLGLFVIGVGLHRATPRTQVAIGLIAFAIPALFLVGSALLLGALPADEQNWFSPTHGDPQVAREAARGEWDRFAGYVWKIDPAFETAVYSEGTYGRQVIVRLATWFVAGFVGVLILLPRAFALFCFGLASARHGWILDPAGHRRAFRWAMICGAGLGLPLQGLATWLWLGEPTSRAILIAIALQYIASLGMSALYLGTVGLLCARETLPRLLHPFEALGRMAFTQYILQSVLAATFFYSWGFGQFGKFSFGELWIVVFCVWAFGLTTSTLWLRKFKQGPLEALWRRLTYLGIPTRA